MNIKKIAIGIPAGVVALGILAIPAMAAFTLFDDASIVAGGNPGNAIQAVSDSAPGWGGASFDDANGSLLSALTVLSTDFNVTDDDCGGGSPRFSIRIDADNDSVQSIGDKNVFVYLGPSPSFTGCTPNTWVSSGNLVTDSDLRWDTSQLAGGTFYDSYTDASTLAGSNVILGISLVVDAGWMFSATDSEQTVLFDNTVINTATYDYEPTATPTPTEVPTPTVTPTPNPFATPTECSEIEGLGAPIVGTFKSETLTGTSGNDLIFAMGGSDKVVGNGGHDCIVGGPGSDKLLGNNGNDVILGGAGSDVIEGNNGADVLYGQADSDTLKGGAGDDTLIGGASWDTARGDGNNDTCDAEKELTCEL